jgi:ferredoxin-NADP reductase
MTLPHKNVDERGEARVFTISSSPTDSQYIAITTRIIQSSFKMTLASLKPGDMVNFGGPWDDLNFEESDKSPHVFLAGGIGITPYHSIVSYVMDKRLDTQMILFASWKNREEMIFDDFFRNANNHLENFTYVPTITDIENLQNWDGEKGRVNEEMLRKYIFDIQSSKYYFSGPPVMIKILKETVANMGVPNEKIIAEEFEGY